MQQVFEQIHACLDESLSLEDLAALVHMSPRHFSRVFKELTGLSPHQYILHARVKRAEYLLLHTDIPIATVARIVGFYSQSHLHRHLKRVLGVTPKQLRLRSTKSNHREAVGTEKAEKLEWFSLVWLFWLRKLSFRAQQDPPNPETIATQRATRLPEPARSPQLIVDRTARSSRDWAPHFIYELALIAAMAVWYDRVGPARLSDRAVGRALLSDAIAALPAFLQEIARDLLEFATADPRLFESERIATAPATLVALSQPSHESGIEGALGASNLLLLPANDLLSARSLAGRDNELIEPVAGAPEVQTAPAGARMMVMAAIEDESLIIFQAALESVPAGAPETPATAASEEAIPAVATGDVMLLVAAEATRQQQEPRASSDRPAIAIAASLTIVRARFAPGQVESFVTISVAPAMAAVQSSGRILALDGDLLLVAPTSSKSAETISPDGSVTVDTVGTLFEIADFGADEVLAGGALAAAGALEPKRVTAPAALPPDRSDGAIFAAAPTRTLPPPPEQPELPSLEIPESTAGAADLFTSALPPDEGAPELSNFPLGSESDRIAML